MTEYWNLDPRAIRAVHVSSHKHIADNTRKMETYHMQRLLPSNGLSSSFPNNLS